jgi:hypothetical protein
MRDVGKSLRRVLPYNETMELLLSYEQNEIMSGWETIESRGLPWPAYHREDEPLGYFRGLESAAT